LLTRLLLALPLAAAGLALDLSRLKATGHVNDFANVIDPASEGRLERYARQIREQTGAEMAFVTLPTLDGEPVEDVANALFRQWGIGSKSSNEGVLFLLAIKERKSRMEVGYGLEAALPDGAAGSVLRAMRPALRQGHYGDAFLAAGQEIGRRILDARNVAGAARPAAPAPVVYRPPGLLMSAWPMLLAFAVAAIILVMSTRRRSRMRSRGYSSLPWMIGGPGPWYGGGSHGGFGGSDSAGGFGGFGGGDSGGGGASSDW